MQDTIFALSSGTPPAAIAIIRISGPATGAVLEQLCGSLPPPRHASLRRLRSAASEVLDDALVLWFPGTATATGEDCGELHCHGGRAVISAIEAELARTSGLRPAEPGEFTRRSFANGRIDLAQAEGLADLLAAETELQRLVAMGSAGGSLSARVETWREQLLVLSAYVEAALDFADEDDAVGLPESFLDRLDNLRNELASELERPHAERLRDGVRVVIAGPPNAGKSSLFNAILEEGAAIVSPEAGTTRDAIERPVALQGIPFILVDTAGLRDHGAGPIEKIGIERAAQEIDRADLVLWLGTEGEGPDQAIEVDAKSDLELPVKKGPSFRVSSVTGEGLRGLIAAMVDEARQILPKPGMVALNRRQRGAVTEALEMIDQAHRESDRDLLVLAEHLRSARVAFDRLLGRESTEAMLDALFARFCIGK